MDKLVYPIVFVSRHYLEVKLKYLLVSASQLLDRKYSLSTKHELAETWRSLRPIIEEIFPGEDQGELNTAEPVLKEFDAKDRSSMVFRYPTDTKHTLHHHHHWTVDLQEFGQTMRKVAAFLDACGCAIDHYDGTKQEMLGSSL